MQTVEILVPLVLGAHLPPHQPQLEQLQQPLLLLIHHRLQRLPVILHIREPAGQKLQFVSGNLLLPGHALHQPAHRSVYRISCHEKACGDDDQNRKHQNPRQPHPDELPPIHVMADVIFPAQDIRPSGGYHVIYHPGPDPAAPPLHVPILLHPPAVLHQAVLRGVNYPPGRVQHHQLLAVAQHLADPPLPGIHVDVRDEDAARVGNQAGEGHHEAEALPLSRDIVFIVLDPFDGRGLIVQPVILVQGPFVALRQLIQGLAVAHLA